MGLLNYADPFSVGKEKHKSDFNSFFSREYQGSYGLQLTKLGFSVDTPLENKSVASFRLRRLLPSFI